MYNIFRYAIKHIYNMLYEGFFVRASVCLNVYFCLSCVVFHSFCSFSFKLLDDATYEVYTSRIFFFLFALLCSHATTSQQLFGPKSAICLNFHNKDESNDESSDIIKNDFQGTCQWKSSYI